MPAFVCPHLSGANPLSQWDTFVMDDMLTAKGIKKENAKCTVGIIFCLLGDSDVTSLDLQDMQYFEYLGRGPLHRNSRFPVLEKQPCIGSDLLIHPLTTLLTSSTCSLPSFSSNTASASRTKTSKHRFTYFSSAQGLALTTLIQ